MKLLNLPSVLSRRRHTQEGKYYKSRSCYLNHFSRSCDEGTGQTVSTKSCLPCWCTAGPSSGTRTTVLLASPRDGLLEQCFSDAWSCTYSLHICAPLLFFEGAESPGRDSSCWTSCKDCLRFQSCAQGKYMRWPECFLLQLKLSNQTGSRPHTSWAMPFSDDHMKCQGNPSRAVQWVLI